MTEPEAVIENGEPTETSPLLDNGKSSPPGERAGDEEGQRGENEEPSADDEVPFADEPTTAQLVLIMSGTWLGSFLAALDSTVIATLTAPISASFHSLSLLSWLASAYFIANAALQPLSGRLTDIMSRQTGLVFSNIFFAAGNLICGLATRQWVMIFGRVVAGIGGGGLTAISTFLGSDLIPLRRRGVWQGFGNISYGLGATMGGVLGGWINDTYGWRAAFLIQIPFTFLSGILVFLNVRVPVKHSTKPPWRRIDFGGAALLILTLVLLLLGVNSGGNIVPWTHPLVLASLPLSAVMLVAFVYVEDRVAAEPIIPVRLLLNRTVASACLTNWFVTMSVFAVLFYGPIFFQVTGLSATKAGLLLVPQSVGTAIGSVVTGVIMRWLGRYYVLSIVVLAIFVASQALLSSFTLATPIWEIIIVFFMIGIGYSGMLTCTLLALISAVEHKHQAVITSASYAFRSTGSAIGITVASAVFQNVLNKGLVEVLGGEKNGSQLISDLKDSLDVLKELPSDVKGPVRDVYVEALRAVFLTTLGLSVLGGIMNLGLKEHTLYKSLARK